MEGKILLVEDHEDIKELVEGTVSSLGYELDYCPDGESGLRCALEGGHALLILDVMLPGLDGIEVCQRVRAENSKVPIMMLTAKGEELDRIMSLELGADDHMTKPFSVAELRARIKALLRRVNNHSGAPTGASSGEQEPVFSYRELTIDRERMIVTLRGEPVELTPLEYDLLELLSQNVGRPFSRSALLESIWGSNVASYEGNVNTHINRLRQKIETDPSNPEYILTKRGVGYLFAEGE